MFETEIFGPCLIRKLKWGCRGPLAPPRGYAPENGVSKVCYDMRNQLVKFTD